MNTYSDEFDLKSLERIQPDLIETSFDIDEIQIGIYSNIKLKNFWRFSPF